MNLGLSSLLERSEFKISKIPVKVVKLDNFLRNKVVKLIKIDVEGTEYDVLKGAIKILRSEKPIVFWEASTIIAKTNVKKSFDFLSRLGYSHYLFSSDKKFTKLTSSEVKEYNLDTNILSMFDFS